VAFGAAYAVYQHPVDQSGVVVQTPVAAATPSTPPDSRGQPVVESDEAVSTELLMAPERGAAADEAEPEAPADQPVAVAAKTPSASPVAVDETADDALSPSAAALENRAQQPSTRIASDEAVFAEAPAKTTAAAKADTEVLGPAKRSRRYPLLLHVQNQLGPDQEREQLTLRIEGKTVARIAVDDDNPKTSVAVPLPRPGLLHYRLEGFSESSGKTELLGHGCIKVRDGSRYAVRRAADGRRVFLEAARKAG